MKVWAKAGISPCFHAFRERAHHLHDEGKLFLDGLLASPENAQGVVPEEQSGQWDDYEENNEQLFKLRDELRDLSRDLQ